jgi:hypothetical protein
MLAYIFWHTPLADIDVHDYETALLGFHTDLAADPPAGLEASATLSNLRSALVKRPSWL